MTKTGQDNGYGLQNEDNHKKKKGAQNAEDWKMLLRSFNIKWIGSIILLFMPCNCLFGRVLISCSYTLALQGSLFFGSLLSLYGHFILLLI